MAANLENLRLILTLTLLSTFCGAGLVLIYYLTEPVIKQSRALDLEQAIRKIIPQTQKIRHFRLSQGILSDGLAEKGDLRIFESLAGEKSTGFVIEASGSGFQDKIVLLYGYDPASETLTGIHIMESKETPGLGDKIGKDPAFLANFRNREVKLTENSYFSPLVLASPGRSKKGHELDGITGATISSRAVVTIINTSAAKALPEVRRVWARRGDHD
ncbi:MAG: RnfABCDGE type electron transport complex subunit G [Spirochaetales bacterium]|nr:RnfABCDGE type electron transport complex subunit G [Spirochaetales bacterium]